MAGLLAWAADVVAGGGAAAGEDEEEGRIPVVFTEEQHRYAAELEGRAAELRRSIQDLRQRIPPPHIAQRLPDLHAHSIASNAALALQLNAHSTTREQAQTREVTLQEENAAYEKAILDCQMKLQERLLEVDLLRSKLKEMESAEEELRTELESNIADKERVDLESSTKMMQNSQFVTVSLESSTAEDLQEKKRELSSVEEMVQRLEDEWSSVQQESLKHPAPAQREKLLEKQLHNLIEQLTSKQASPTPRVSFTSYLYDFVDTSLHLFPIFLQAQAEGLKTQVRAKEKELDQLNALRINIESGTTDSNVAMARNRFTRGGLARGGTPFDNSNEAYKMAHAGGRIESMQKFMILRSSFLLYLLALHVIVFVKISF